MFAVDELLAMWLSLVIAAVMAFWDVVVNDPMMVQWAQLSSVVHVLSCALEYSEQVARRC